MKKFVTAFIALLTALSITAILPACRFGGDNSSDGHSTQNGDNTANNGNQNDEDNTDNDSDEPVTQYSGILNAVLNSDYYDDISDEYVNSYYHEDTDFYYYEIRNSESPIPYTFLEREGYDIEKIKSGELSCETVAYIMDGDTTRLYISTQPESPAGYYGNYILSYPLTQQEYEDLYMLHDKLYFQAGLFVQELDAQKRATVESHIDVEKETFEATERGLGRLAANHTNTTSNYTVDIVSINPEDLEFSVNVRKKQYRYKSQAGYSLIQKSEVYTVICYSFPAYYEYGTNYLKLSYPTSYGVRDVEQFQTKRHDIIYFNTQGGQFGRDLRLDI